MDVKDFYYDLPQELIAQDPLEDRSSSRLMVLGKTSGEIIHRRFSDITEYLKPGDCLVINNTKVIPARLYGVKEGTEAKIEILLLKRKENDIWETLVKPGKKAKIGTKIIFLLPEESIQKAITVALPVIALIMVLRKTDARNVIMRSEISKKTVVQALIVGVLMGFYNSLFGPGIGTVAIIAFTMIMHYDARCASGNGKVLIVLTNAIALVSYVKTGNVAYEIACPAALCAIAGNLVGVNLAIRKGEKIIKPVMLVVVILTVIKFAWQNHLWG